MVTFIIIFILATVVTILTIFIVKAVVSPKQLETIPKLIKQGKTQQAVKVAKQILTKDSKNYAAHYYLGKAYIKDNKPELALIEYKTVNENALFGQEIDELSFRQEFANLLVKFNQQGEALKNFLLLTKLSPTNAENYYQIGTIYEQQNRYDLALGYMQKCVRIDKKHAKAHAEIGLMLYRTKQYKDAKKEIDMALKLSPETYSSYYYLGKILKDGKDISGAIKAFEKAQRDTTVKQKAIIEHGSCYMMVNRLDNAIVDFERAIDLDKTNTQPETLFARYFLGICYEKLRKIDKAIEQWENNYKTRKDFRDVASRLSGYKDLQANDFLKDYLTCNNEEFLSICKTAAASLKLQILSCDSTKWGCQITGVNKGDESWMALRKQVILLRFCRDPDPIEDAMIHDTLDALKQINSVKAYLFSSSGFTTSAKRFAENRPVELVERNKLESLLSSVCKK